MKCKEHFGENNDDVITAPM